MEYDKSISNYKNRLNRSINNNKIYYHKLKKKTYSGLLKEIEPYWNIKDKLHEDQYERLLLAYDEYKNRGYDLGHLTESSCYNGCMIL